MKGLYSEDEHEFESAAKPDEGLLPCPLGDPGSLPGLAQASQSSAEIWLTDATASREISENAIDCLDRPRLLEVLWRGDQPKIVHRSDDFKCGGRSGFRAKALENHLVCMPRGDAALLRRAHRPGQERAAEHVARDPWRRRRQVVDPIGDKMRAGAERVPQMHHAAALRSRRPRPVPRRVVA